MSGTSVAQGEHINPFVGPRPLERGQPIFGRDKDIDDLYYLLSAERIVLFHSPSGAGKSSLLQAGLIPRLQQQFDVWAPVRVNLAPDSAAGVNGPGDDIMFGLLSPPPLYFTSNEAAGENRYLRSCVLGFEAEVPKELRRPADVIEKMTLAEYVTSRPRRRSAPKNIVLIFDQFEEVLTTDPNSVGPKQRFFYQLGQLLRDPHIWAIFALREDFLAAFDPYASLVPTNFKNRFRLDLLKDDAAKEAITKTAALDGKTFSTEAMISLLVSLEGMKVQLPDGSFGYQFGQYVEPLHLQVACRNLWQRMDPGTTEIQKSDIAEFGDVSVALGEYYASEVGKIGKVEAGIEREIREWFGNELITRDRARGSVQRGFRLSGNLSNRLIEELIKSHLVRAELHAGSTWYELAHDQLIDPVLKDNEAWFAAHLNKAQQRAAQWAKENEPWALLLTGKDLEEAERWAKQPEVYPNLVERRFLDACRERRRRKRQGQAALALLICLLFVISGLGFQAWRAQKRAEANLSLAKQAVDQSLSSAGRQQGREAPDSPDIEAFRKELLGKAATFYAAFISYNSGNEELRAESASAHSRLADINRLLDKRDDSVKEYKNAISAFEKLAKDHPKEAIYPQRLAYCHNWLGETLRQWYERGSTPDKTLAAEATTEYNAALSLQQQIHDAMPGNAQNTQELARSHYNRGILENDLGERNDAETDLRAAMALLEPLVGQNITVDPQQNTPSAAQDLARTDNDLAALDAKQENNDEARKLYERAIEIGGQLVSADKDRREYKYELANYYDNEARLLVDLGDQKLAAERNHDSLDLIEELTTPASSIGLEEAKILQLRSKILMQTGAANALEEAERERELLNQLQSGGLSQGHPLFHVIYQNLALNYLDLAKMELKNGNVADAQLSLKSLALVIPELAPEDKPDIAQSYEYYQRQLKTGRSSRK
jgi:tetratricopeptide (TPR) repeat protein